jgi:hypothetical protein
MLFFSCERLDPLAAKKINPDSYEMNEDPQQLSVRHFDPIKMPVID